MRNNKYNLVILHHKEVFETRELALEYLNGFYKPFSLDAEPVIVKYGNVNNPDVILAFGTSDAAPGGFYAIDMTKATQEINELNEIVSSSQDELEYIADILDGVVKSTGLVIDENKIEDKISYEPDSRDEVIGSAVTIAQALDLLSKYTQKEFGDNKLAVEESKTIKLIYSVNPDGGMILKAKVKVSTEGDSDDVNFNNNIIGIKNDGLYAASNLAYDDVRHQLIFTTSGYKNGRFQDDAIVQKIDLGEHTKLVADNDGKNVKLFITENTETYTTTLSADLQIANRENNILKSVDGKVYVDGVAENIKYSDSNVGATLTEHKNQLNALETSVQNAANSAHIEGGQTDTLETSVSTLSDGGAKVVGNVRLGSKNSIVVRNGGLEANITIDVDTATNKLIFTIGDETIVKTLPGVELFESAEYNDENEELIITFRTGNTLVIPIHNIIHTWETANSENSPIVLTKTVITGGVDTLSGNVKLRSTDNLLGNDNGKLFVSEQNIDNKISVETTRATNAENAIRTSIDTLTNNVQSQLDSVSETISGVQNDLTEETTRARSAETEIRNIANHANEIAEEAKTGVTELNSDVAELSNSLTAVETNVENLSESIAEIAVLRNSLNEEITNRTTKDTELEGSISAIETSVTTEKNRATTAEEAIITRITHDISDVNAAITAEQTRAVAAEQANASRIEELAAAVGSGSAQTLADAKAYTDTKVLAEKTERETKDTEIETAIQTLDEKIENNKFIVNETNTISMSLASGEPNVLTSNVKVKTISGENANIIKSDENGLFATVSFNYDKATNKITFNDGNGDKTFELNNFGILQDAFYDSENKSIVLIVKKDDETTERITIPVGDLVNTWDVENNTNSPIILTKTTGDNGDVLSAQLSILNNENNLLVNNNGSLFVDGDSNAHKALWGNEVTTVQGVINTLWNSYNESESTQQDVADLKQRVNSLSADVTGIQEDMTTLTNNVNNIEEDNENIKQTLLELEEDINSQVGRITTNETNISNLTERVTTIEGNLQTLTETVNSYNERISAVETKADEAIGKIDNLIANIGDGTNLMERIEHIEEVLGQLIDFGEYEPEI